MTPYTLSINKAMFRQIRKAISIVIIVAFFSTSVRSPAYAQSAPGMMPLPAPGLLVHLSPEFTPAHLLGITIHPDNALQFDFLIHQGDQNLEGLQRKEEYRKLIKYFLASLTIPDDDQWVNLSPYERNRIIKDDFGKTEMGRDLLAEDYMLKQITSSLIYPEDGLGKKFWDKIYARAWEEYHTTNIPVNTFNKVWIVPDMATVYESGNSAYILHSHLRVMLEEDYLSLSKHSAIADSPTNDTHAIGSQVVREIVLPELEKEVNEGKNFANLRQMYSGMVLAAWYKHALKASLLGEVYANKAKVKGVDQNPKNNEEIYKRYLRAFKKGVFNYIKEDVDKYTNEAIPRKYFSGGFGNHLAGTIPFGQYTLQGSLTPEQQQELFIATNLNAVPSGFINTFGGNSSTVPFVTVAADFLPENTATALFNGTLGAGLVNTNLNSSLPTIGSNGFDTGMMTPEQKATHMSEMAKDSENIEAVMRGALWSANRLNAADATELLQIEAAQVEAINRALGDARGRFGLMNHWLDIVSPEFESSSNFTKAVQLAKDLAAQLEGLDEQRLRQLEDNEIQRAGFQAAYAQLKAHFFAAANEFTTLTPDQQAVTDLARDARELENTIGSIRSTLITFHGAIIPPGARRVYEGEINRDSILARQQLAALTPKLQQISLRFPASQNLRKAVALVTDTLASQLQDLGARTALEMNARQVNALTGKYTNLKGLLNAAVSDLAILTPQMKAQLAADNAAEVQQLVQEALFNVRKFNGYKSDTVREKTRAAQTRLIDTKLDAARKNMASLFESLGQIGLQHSQNLSDAIRLGETLLSELNQLKAEQLLVSQGNASPTRTVDFGNYMQLSRLLSDAVRDNASLTPRLTPDQMAMTELTDGASTLEIRMNGDVVASANEFNLLSAGLQSILRPKISDKLQHNILLAAGELGHLIPQLREMLRRVPESKNLKAAIPLADQLVGRLNTLNAADVLALSKTKLNALERQFSRLRRLLKNAEKDAAMGFKVEFVPANAEEAAQVFVEMRRYQSPLDATAAYNGKSEVLIRPILERNIQSLGGQKVDAILPFLTLTPQGVISMKSDSFKPGTPQLIQSLRFNEQINQLAAAVVDYYKTRPLAWNSAWTNKQIAKQFLANSGVIEGEYYVRLSVAEKLRISSSGVIELDKAMFNPFAKKVTTYDMSNPDDLRRLMADIARTAVISGLHQTETATKANFPKDVFDQLSAKNAPDIGRIVSVVHDILVRYSENAYLKSLELEQRINRIREVRERVIRNVEIVQQNVAVLSEPDVIQDWERYDSTQPQFSGQGFIRAVVGDGIIVIKGREKGEDTRLQESIPVQVRKDGTIEAQEGYDLPPTSNVAKAINIHNRNIEAAQKTAPKGWLFKYLGLRLPLYGMLAAMPFVNSGCVVPMFMVYRAADSKIVAVGRANEAKKIVGVEAADLTWLKKNGFYNEEGFFARKIHLTPIQIEALKAHFADRPVVLHELLRLWGVEKPLPHEALPAAPAHSTPPASADSVTADNTDLGGIDFNAANLDLRIKRDGKGVPLPFVQQDLSQLMKIQGFLPVIISIKPAVNIPILSELQQKLQPASV